MGVAVGNMIEPFVNKELQFGKLFWQVFEKPAIVSKLRDLLRDHKVS